MEIGSIIMTDWEIVKALGQGSFGKVYLAKKCTLGEETFAAIKIISIPQSDSQISEQLAGGYTRKTLSNYFRSVVQDWHMEIKMMEKLKALPNIVGADDHQIIEHDDGIHWDILIRMEYLTPFNSYIMTNVIKTEDALKLACDLCSALEYCEIERILHRDIKPENIFISKFGIYKLGDFGIARQVEGLASSLSRKGTDNYMSPEVYLGQNYDHTTDIYSLGLVIYRLFNQNKLPFVELGEAPMSLSDRSRSIVQRMNGIALPVPINASEEISRIILKACSFDPSNRYQHAKSMKDDFQKVLESLDSSENRVLIDLTANEENISFVEKTDDVSTRSPENVITLEDQDKTTPLVLTPSSNPSPVPVPVHDDHVKSDLPIVEEVVPKKETLVDSDILGAINKSVEKKAKISEKSGKNRKPVYIASLLMILILLGAIAMNPFKNVNKPSTVIVPMLVSMQKDEAISALEKLGLSSSVEIVIDDTKNEGTVISQSKPMDTVVEKGEKISITITAKTSKIAMPNLIGLSIPEAERIVEQTGLTLEVKAIINDSKTLNQIFEQSISKGTSIGKGSKVVVSVYIKSGNVTIPAGVGAIFSEYKVMLESLGLKVTYSEVNNNAYSDGKVISVAPKQGTAVKEGSTISVVVSKGALVPQAFSAWVEVLPANITPDKYEIVPANQFRSTSAKLTTSSTLETMAGWTKDGQSTSQGEWSTTYSTTKIVATPKLAVKTETVLKSPEIKMYRYYHYCGKVYGTYTTSTGYMVSFEQDKADFAMYQFYRPSIITITSPTSSAMKKIIYSASETTYAASLGQKCYWNSTAGIYSYVYVPSTNFYVVTSPAIYETRYYTATITTTYYYWRWDESKYSAWGFTQIAPSASINVQSRKVYKYRLK